MGTSFELVLAGSDPVRLAAAAEAALEEIESCAARWSRWRTDSLVARIARLAPGESLRLDRDSFELLELAEQGRQASRGAFDVRLGGRMAQALGERTSTGELGGFALEHADCRLRCTGSPLELDLGGIAKGHALDLAARELRAAGIDCALLHGGTSSVVAIGSPPGLRGWSIALGSGPQAPRICLRDQALACSGTRGRRTAQGASHVLDPRTGSSLAREGRALACAPTAALAEIWSTALLVTETLAGAPAEVRGAYCGEEDNHWHFERFPQLSTANPVPLVQSA